MYFPKGYNRAYLTRDEVGSGLVLCAVLVVVVCMFVR
jgi:hypothetical protein